MRTLVSLLVVLGVAVLLAAAQDGRERPIDRVARGMNTDAFAPAPPPVSRPRVDSARIRSEADEIARLAKSVPAQVSQTEHGVLPKDLSQNLKQIEKLAKRLRRELNL